ncbi:MAG: hypothetical protein ACI8TQ_003447 [Planctomycetota bacterium]
MGLSSPSEGLAGFEQASSSRSLSAIVGSFVFLAAFLSFLVQPLAARYLLPSFGGGSSVWTICLVFFQVTLTLGYAYAHFVARVVPIAHQQWLHAGLLILSTAAIPIMSGTSVAASHDEDPALQLLWFLFKHLGLPFLLLCGTSPLVQSWYARVKGGATYQLYGLSNLGSLLGLLAYPFVLEPLLGLAEQRVLWSAFYVALVLVSVACWRAFAGIRLDRPVAESAPSESPLLTPKFARLMWLLIPACASILMLAISSRITQDIAPVPLLWVLPIGLYLLAFALAFSDRPGLGRGVWIGLSGASLMASIYVMQLEQAGDGPELLVRLAAHMSPVFFVSRALFGELFRLRPPTNRLTSYYLVISIGGALGGMFVGLVAPQIFLGYWELPIAYCMSTVLIALCVLAGSEPDVVSRRPFSILGWVAALAFIEISLLEHTQEEMDGALMTRRGFYGVLSIYESREDDSHKFTLYHGNICHGVQFFDAENVGEPTTYYSRESGVGLARIIHEPRGKRPRIGSCWHFADTCPRRRPCKVVEDASICKVPAGTNRPAVPVVRGVWSACS